MSDEEIRLYLHAQMVEAFPDLGIYYRPPGNTILRRPCILYESLKTDAAYANNTPYVVGTQFKVTLLSDIPGINKRPMRHLTGVVVEDDRSFVAEDVVNDVFTISVNII